MYHSFPYLCFMYRISIIKDSIVRSNDSQRMRLTTSTERNRVQQRIVLICFLNTNNIVKRDHDVFLGDLEFENVDPLSADEFEDGKWDESKVMGSKGYYRDGKKLSSSVPSTIVNYFDENYEYEMRIKKYNELLADVRKPLEYKDDGKKKDKKSTSRWGRKGKKEEKKKEEKKPVPTEPDEITPKPFPSMDASVLHAKAVTDSQGDTVNQYPTKISVLPSDATYLGREGVAPTGVWSDSSLTKVYILPLGSHKIDDYEVSIHYCYYNRMHQPCLILLSVF